ncbi:MAG: HAMP domain-containing sensor histidine kinase [Miltoncostaeaceae bacterium]
MDTTPRPSRTWPRALAAGLVATALACLIALAAMVAGLRADAGRTSDALRAEAARLAAGVDGAGARQAEPVLESAGVAARLVGPRGGVIADGDLDALWGAAAAPLGARLALVGAGTTVRRGAVEESVALADGRTLTVRAPLSMGAGGVVDAGPGLVVLLILVGMGAAGASALGGRRRRSATSRRAEAVLAAAAGRVPGPAAARGAWAPLDLAILHASERVRELRDAAEVRMEALGAAVAPLPMPAAARTPSGGVVRNDALERLVHPLAPADRDAAEAAVSAGVNGRGATARRVDLADGRVLEMESWAVPGGRVVVLAERTEQARLAALRAHLTGSASQQLRGPIAEIATRAGEIADRGPVSVGSAAGAIRASADRLDRLVARMLRAGGVEDASRRPTPRAVGVGALAHGLGTAYDARLRERGLRLEHDLPADGLGVVADPALVHEVLAELIDNAAAATSRGGVITLAARRSGAAEVEILVQDTGEGIPARERPRVLEPFGRAGDSSARPGAGLGLGVARALAERMGGRVEVHDGPGGRARLVLPAASYPVPEPATPISVAAPDAVPEPVDDPPAPSGRVPEPALAGPAPSATP